MKTKAIILAVILGIGFFGISQTTFSQETKQVEGTEKSKELNQKVDGLSKEIQELKDIIVSKEELKKEVERQIGWQISWSKWIIMFAVSIITLVIVIFSLIIAWWSTRNIKDAKEEFDKEIVRAMKQNEKFEKDYKELIEKANKDIETRSTDLRKVARDEFDKYQEKLKESAEKEREMSRLFNEGWRYYEEEKYQAAIDIWNKLIDLKPDDKTLVATYNNHGAAYIYLKQYNKAIENCAKALKINPKYASAHFNFACAYARRGEEGDKDRMLGYLKKAIELDDKFKKDAKDDNDFKKYLDDPDFKKLIE